MTGAVDRVIPRLVRRKHTQLSSAAVAATDLYSFRGGASYGCLLLRVPRYRISPKHKCSDVSVGEVTEIKEDKKDFHGSRESSLQCRCVLDVGATALVTEAATAIFGKASVNAVTGVMTGKRWKAFVADSKEAYDDDDEEEE
ncbi:hypothetical protein LWI29_008773 [Acer saccharum]|uniref:Uncharacterized protein n=1 Tax=Acer saccharum TaxID=4024 RepID=A0AA39W145_ACESA|nr:hypothetical protein LWI29_008773 [Acer saccharum]